MALLTTQTILRSGITPTYGAVAASDTFTPGNGVFLHVKNAGASPDTVAVQVLQGDPSATLVIADLSISVTNGQERMIGPLPANFFADPVTGLGTVTHSFTTSVTVAVLNLQQP
jgi:hypothetical protein